MREEGRMREERRTGGRVRIRVTLLPAGKRKAEVVEWEYDGEFEAARGLASRISNKGLITGQGGADSTIYPVQRIEKVEVFKDGQK